MSPFHERLVRALQLDPAIYEEVESDPEALGQAVALVVASSLAAGVGTGGEGGLLVALLGVLASLGSWYVWALLTYLIGTRILPGPRTQADLGQLLRTTGFSTAPGLLRVLGIVPPLRGFVFAAAGLWMLVAMVIAVRQALDYETTGRALGVCAIGFLVQAAALALMLGGLMLVRPDLLAEPG